MKKILQSIAFLLLCVFQCLGQEETQSDKTAEAKPEEAKEVADINISKAFPYQEITDKMETPFMQVYTYKIDQEFAGLEKKVKAFLGEHWAKMEDTSFMDGPLKATEAAGMKVQGVAIYHNPKKLGSMVMMMQMVSKEAEENKPIVTLTYTWHKLGEDLLPDQ